MIPFECLLDYIKFKKKCVDVNTIEKPDPGYFIIISVSD